ncbi:MAG: DNA polymerase III subunit epsilon [Nitrospirae bacterium]|nr:DNA polymerase III subunit epsilon [Nitrospirota bacterium]
MLHTHPRQIVLDTETTGLSPTDGHRVLEIGAVELVNLHPTGNRFQVYLNPERDIPDDSIRIHGITNERVAGEPKFFEVAERFLEFIADSPLVIHNAAFDLAFLNHELTRCGKPDLSAHPVIDTLAEARRRHPRQRNSLDALCRRYEVDSAHRTLHGALLDAEILTDVYVAMLGGHQTVLVGMEEQWGAGDGPSAGMADGAAPDAVAAPACGLIPAGATLPAGRRPLLAATSPEELEAHGALLRRLGEACIWQAAPAEA